mgnify:CR=1 FL=1
MATRKKLYGVSSDYARRVLCIQQFSFAEAVEADYIEETEYSMAEIAGMLGYDNPSKFAAAFRSVVGCSPREYKKSSERMEHLTLLGVEIEE